ncbi:hypothetical protein KBTX_00707 [wastewater metagenome]|uniref:Uncharacterized protein n=2 Tax=unclassified sequences TaxID=12908 RepID=A0A5B8R643_9ZZZZ|nr:ABZJ_00895 family protein [Arhodomonas sp. KWT]QEA04399.1 hypothetical protein KBTEX_00707 [uncultured organism]
MSIPGAILRFLLIYVMLLLAAGAVVDWLGLDAGSGVNIGILCASVLWVCDAFGRRNGRYFSNGERNAVFLGMVIVDVAVQGGVTAAVLAAEEGPVDRGAVALGLLVVGLSHMVLIGVVVALSRRGLRRRGIVTD